MADSGEEWELSKENIRPIQQGRKQKVLKVALAPHPEDTITQQRQAFENELRTYSGNDPLAIWCNYIKWVEQNYPKGGREGHIKKLMDSCLSVFKDDKRYFNDERYIDILLKYANLSGKPVEIYNYMYNNNIGCKSAKFFINWSWELEQLGNLKKADEVLTEGIKHRAEPVEKILSYRGDFEIRFANKIKADSEGDSVFEPESGRSAFAVLKPQKKNLAPVLRTGAAVLENKASLVVGRHQPQPKSSISSGKVPFKIYDAENIRPSSVPSQSQSVAHNIFSHENFKENEQKPIKWNKFKVKSQSVRTHSESNPNFKFHCDDENDQQIERSSRPRSVPKTSNILSSRRRTPSPPIALFEPEDPYKKPMYPKNKVYGGAVEFSLEELRAAEWREKMKKIEQEQIILEQQKKIEEHVKAEEQLKKKIQLLAKQVEVLQTQVTGSTPSNIPMINNETVSLKSVDNYGANSVLNKQGNSLMQKQNKISIQNCQNQPERAPFIHSEENSGGVSETKMENTSSNLTETYGGKCAESTSFYAKVVQDFYNRTLTTEECENKKGDTNKVNEIGLENDILKECIEKVPFSFYHDPTVKIPNSNEIISKDILNENACPSLNAPKHINEVNSTSKTPDKLPFTFFHDSSEKIPSKEIVKENSISSLNSNKHQNISKEADKLPFTFYQDPTESISNSSKKKHSIQKCTNSNKPDSELPFTFFCDPSEKIHPKEGVNENFFCGLNSNKQQNTVKETDKLPFTFYQDPTESLSNSNKVNQSIQKCTNSKESGSELPLTFYDSSEKVPKSSETFSVREFATAKEKHLELPYEESFEENVENVPPGDYNQSTEKRELAGILQPSKNILFIPLEQQELDDESDIEDDSIYQNRQHHAEDMTLIPPSNTEQFKAAQFLASTPYVPRNSRSSSLVESDHQTASSEKNNVSQNACSVPVDLNLHKNADENSVSKTEMSSSKEPGLSNELKSVCSSRLPNILSIIMETSRENYSKSSSSSSSASLTKSNHLEQYSAQHFSLHKNFSKLETCEAINSVSEVSNHNSDTNISSSNTVMPKRVNKEMHKSIQFYQVDFDPFDVNIIQRLLKSINIDSYKICHINKSIKAVKPDEDICIGNSKYKIESLIAVGAYAKVYKATKISITCNDNQSNVFALKACKKGNEWEIYICCEIQKRLSELKLMPDIKNSVMNAIFAIKYNDGMLLVDEYSNLGTLLDVVNFYKKQNSTIPELITMYFTLEILHIVSQLHKCNIIHGDIKPDNFLLINDSFDVDIFQEMTKTTCLKLIDFGRAIDLNLFEKGICFTSVFSSKDLQCNEMKDKKPWVFQLDWYGVLSCIYTMLFSEYMVVSKKNDLWGIEKKFKRYWFTSLWEPLFNTLLNIPECYEEPDVTPFITMIESKLKQNASTFINLLTRFSCAYSRRI